MEFTEAAPLRAWLANNFGLNSFFNGDARSLRADVPHTAVHVRFCRSMMSSLRRGRRR